MSQLGRISGPLLKANLLRDGVDLAFETDLLYLDVNNMRVGIKTSSPTHDLHINGTTRTTNLTVDNQLDVGPIAAPTISITGNTITGNNGYLNLTPNGVSPVVYQSKLRVDDIEIENNDIRTYASNTNIELRPNGTGTVDVFSNMNVNGDIHATGNIRADGSIQLGDADTDNVTFNADISSNIIPNTDVTYNLGAPGKRWANVYADTIVTTGLTTDNILISGIDLTLRPGNTYYVGTNGSDTATGTHQNDPFLTVKHALSVAGVDDVVYIYPGTYSEIFPLTVPAGVTVRGAGIRAVKIVPTVATKNNDAFLVNGETTIEDLTVADFFSPGYAFKFAPGFTVTKRSPYIRNITVITKGSVTSSLDPYGYDAGDAGKGALIDGSVVTVLSKEASMLFHAATFITPNVDTITATNGARIEWLNSFTYFANRGFYAYSGSSGFAGAGKTALRLSNTTGTFNVGDTVTYYSTYPTALASGTISNKDADGKIYLTGKVTGLETASSRTGKSIVAFGDAKLSTAVKKFGTASLSLDGTGDFVSIQSTSDFGFGTGDFTVEGWVNKNDNSGTEILFEFRTAVASIAPIVYFSGTNIIYQVGSTSIINAASGFLAGSWNHIAVSRVSGNTRLFVNGNQIGSTYSDSNNYVASPLRIGVNLAGSGGFNGYVDDVRISKGIARYTANFPTPTGTVQNDQYTVLLSRFDGADLSTTFTDESILVQDVRSSSGGTAQFIDLVDYSDFGAEVRAIGSANIYGNYGAYGDGLGILMYLISQNFAYIGSGKDTSNDPLTVVQANEVVQLNDAKIFYTSVDHKGDFRVGELFYVNQETGVVEFTSSQININSSTGLVFDNGTSQTYIDATKVQTGNVKVSGNTVESLSGDLNLLSSTDLINLQNNVAISGNLDVTGNVTIGGNITVGDQNTDSIAVTARIDSNLIPNVDNTFNLGSSLQQWQNLYVEKLQLPNIEVTTNFITTTESNSNLELRANGTGSIYVPNNNVEIDQNLTVDGLTTLSNTNITGTLTHVGTTNHTGDYNLTGSATISNNLTVNNTVQFANIKVDTNYITTTVSDSDLELRANGTGKIYVPNNNVEFDQNLTVNGTITTPTLNASAINTSEINLDNIRITSNYITTTDSNSDLELVAAGTGRIYVPNNNVEFDQNLTVSGLTTLANTNINGTVTHTGNAQHTGTYTLTGNLSVSDQLLVTGVAQFENIKVETNYITTTNSNSDLELRASGTGRVYVPFNDVEINQDLTVNGAIITDNLTVTGTITADEFGLPQILIKDNYITTTPANVNLELRANGTGKIYLPTNSLELDKNLIVKGTSYFSNINVVGELNQTGNTTVTGNYSVDGNIAILGNITVDGITTVGDIQITNNQISATNVNNNLELRANGTGVVSIPNHNLVVDKNVTVGGSLNVSSLTVSTSVTGVNYTNGNIVINTNYITTTDSNSDLELRTSGTGRVLLQDIIVDGTSISTVSDTDITLQPGSSNSLSIDSNTSLVLPAGTTGDRPTAVAGMIRFNTSTNQFEGYNGTDWINLQGVYDVDQNTYVVAESSPGANDNTIYFYANGTQVADLDESKLTVVGADIDNIRISSNTVTTITSGTDLILTGNGTGAVKIGNFEISGSEIVNTVVDAITTVSQTGTGYFKIPGTKGFVIPHGTTVERPGITEVGLTRFNTTDQRMEVWDGDEWVGIQGPTGGITQSQAEDIALTSALLFG